MQSLLGCHGVKQFFFDSRGFFGGNEFVLFVASSTIFVLFKDSLKSIQEVQPALELSVNNATKILQQENEEIVFPQNIVFLDFLSKLKIYHLHHLVVCCICRIKLGRKKRERK